MEIETQRLARRPASAPGGASPAPPLFTGLAVGGVLLCAASAAIALANGGSGGGAGWAAVGVITIAAPVGVGLYAWHRDPAGRFGLLLVAAGYGWFLTTLGHSDQALLYSVGRVSAWVFEPVLIYVLLAYPSGRLTRSRDRIMVLAAVLVVATMYLPTALLVAQYPHPSPFSGCTAHCPSNSFQVTSSEPGFIDAILRPARDVITIGIYLGVAVLLGLRLGEASPLYKLTLRPVLAAASLRFTAAFLYIVLRRAGAGDGALEAVALVTVLTVPAASIGFLWGLISWRLHEVSALERLTLGLGEATDPGRLRDLMADAIGDRRLEFYYLDPDRGRWRDSSGRPVDRPRTNDERFICEIADGDGTAAILACDRALGDEHEFVEAVGACALTGLETQRLATALKASLRDIDASRARLALAADSERQRIERDLHDGAQQHLVTLRVKLELATEKLRDDPAEGSALLRELGPEIDEIIDQIRSLAQDIYPPVLSSGGLGDALRSAALQASLPVHLEVDGIGRYPIEVESAIYFCCLEALTNASKHAEGATGAWVDIAEAGELRFEVRDDGCGFSPSDPGRGAGLTNMRDRLDAVGGALTVSSEPGHGTSIRGMAPVPVTQTSS